MPAARLFERHGKVVHTHTHAAQCYYSCVIIIEDFTTFIQDIFKRVLLIQEGFNHFKELGFG